MVSSTLLEKAKAHKETSKITEVKEGKDGYTIMKSDGWSFWIPKKYGVIPKVGDKVAFYGKGIGYTVQGIDINGKEVFFKTQAELDAEHEAFCKKFQEDNLRNYNEVMEKIKSDEPFETIDISGMSGSYEWGCQMMLKAGLKFLKEHPDFHFDYQQYNGVAGIAFTDTPWGKELDKVLDEASGHNSTGAMHQAVINHLMFIHKNGYEEWLKQVPKERRYTYPIDLPPPKS